MLPDDWDSNHYTLNRFNDAETSFDSNIVSFDDWDNLLEPYGVVFLPAAGNREGTSIDGLGRFGDYWSTTNYGTQFALYVSFGGLHVGQIIEKRCAGRSVRLVYPAN